MQKYTIKEVAEMLKVDEKKLRAKINTKSFDKEFLTTTKNFQNRNIQAITEAGIEKLKDMFVVNDEKVNAEDKTLLGELKLVKEGNFLGTVCDFYQDETDNVYMTREQITQALEYADKSAIRKMHNSNKDTFDGLSVEISSFNKVGKVLPHHEEQANKPISNLQQDTVLYNEDGIYEITALSRQPKANEFRKWVREVLKTIRKTGGFVNDKELFIKSYFRTQDENDRYLIKSMMLKVDELADKIKNQEDIITKMTPEAEFGKRLMSSETDIPLNVMSRILHNNGYKIGRNRLFSALRDMQLVMKVKVDGFLYNIPTQKAIDMEIMKVKTTPFKLKNGMDGLSYQTIITPKGQEYIVRKFLKEK